MIRSIVGYLEDSLLAVLQRRCDHPGNMVAADILEGCADGIEVKYCRRCGAIRPHYADSRSVWRFWHRPDPHLWRDRISCLGRLMRQ